MPKYIPIYPSKVKNLNNQAHKEPLKSKMEKTMDINELCFKNFYVWSWPHNKVAFVNSCLDVSSYASATFHNIKLLIDKRRISEWINLV